MSRTRLREATVARAKQMGINVNGHDREFILSSPQAWEGRPAHGSGNYRTLWISDGAYATGSLWAHEFGHSSGWVGHANFCQVLPGGVHPFYSPGTRVQLGFASNKPIVQVTFESGPQQPPIDDLPTIDVIEPSRGVTLRSAVYAFKSFAATAFDADVGTYDGAGIDSVLFEVGFYNQFDMFESKPSGADAEAP